MRIPAPLKAAVFMLITCRIVFQAGALAQSTESSVTPLPEYSLEPVYRVQAKAGHEQLITSQTFGFQKTITNTSAVAFTAVRSADWLPGLVPVFLVEKQSSVELRRLPPRGLESVTEPFFFALPLENEDDALKISGFWRCEAIRGDGTHAWPDFELATFAGKLGGRFSPSSEYRYATIAGGSYHSNRVEIRVEYLNDSYLLTGTWREAQISGVWENSSGAEKGTWKKLRATKRLLFLLRTRR